MAWARFRKKDMPSGLWAKCPSCSAMLFQKDLDARGKVCPECDHHFPISAAERIAHTLDRESFQELHSNIRTVDRLGFVDKEPYSEKIKATMAKTSMTEAMVIGLGKLRGRDLVFGVLDFQFLGGSMGSVVGEKVTLAIEEATARKWPLVLVAASGGARMHEGALSLMQMAKTCAALARFAQQRGLYISILSNPTTGGVTASWATQADIILAEPKALIGFAGPRVIQNTLRQDLPEGFQSSEFLLGRGQIDRIVSRVTLPQRLAELIHFLQPHESDFTSAPAEVLAVDPASESETAKDFEDVKKETKKDKRKPSPKSSTKSKPSKSKKNEKAKEVEREAGE